MTASFFSANVPSGNLTTPNAEGSPNLYANATGIDPPKAGTEVFFKNVSVTPNK